MACVYLSMPCADRFLSAFVATRQVDEITPVAQKTFIIQLFEIMYEGLSFHNGQKTESCFSDCYGKQRSSYCLSLPSVPSDWATERLLIIHSTHFRRSATLGGFILTF